MNKIEDMTAQEFALWIAAKRRPIAEVQRALETWSTAQSAKAVAYARERRFTYEPTA